jgi:hypothetical protein
MWSAAAGTAVSQGQVPLCAFWNNSKPYQGPLLVFDNASYPLTSVADFVQSDCHSLGCRESSFVHRLPRKQLAASTDRRLTENIPPQSTACPPTSHRFPPPHTKLTKVPVLSRGSSHNRKETKKSRKLQKKIPCDALRPLRRPLHRCRATFPFHDRTSQVEGKQRIRLSTA